MLLKTSREPSQLVDVVNALHRQAVDFQGPFRTASGRLIFRIKDQIVLESELRDLLESGQLDPAGIANLLRKLRAS